MIQKKEKLVELKRQLKELDAVDARIAELRQNVKKERTKSKAHKKYVQNGKKDGSEVQNGEQDNDNVEDADLIIEDQVDDDYDADGVQNDEPLPKGIKVGQIVLH